MRSIHVDIIRKRIHINRLILTVAEMVPPRFRVLMGLIAQIPYAVGNTLMAGIGFVFKNYQHINFFFAACIGTSLTIAM